MLFVQSIVLDGHAWCRQWTIQHTAVGSFCAAGHGCSSISVMNCGSHFFQFKESYHSYIFACCCGLFDGGIAG